MTLLILLLAYLLFGWWSTLIGLWLLEEETLASLLFWGFLIAWPITIPLWLVVFITYYLWDSRPEKPIAETLHHYLHRNR